MIFNSQIYCAFVILLQLAESHSAKGCLLKDISCQHRIPLEELEDAAAKLEQAKLIIVQRSMNEWLLLADDPSQIRTLDVIELFTKNFFGRFINPESGRMISQSHTLRFLSEKQAEAEKNIRDYWYKITLDRLCQMKNNKYI